MKRERKRHMKINRQGCAIRLYGHNSELDALFSVIDHMDVLNQSFYDFNDDMSYYLHEKGTEGEAWEKAEKANQQREGYAPKN